MNLEGKTFLITGGTGSFGNAVLKKLIDSDYKEIRIFSWARRQCKFSLCKEIFESIEA